MLTVCFDFISLEAKFGHLRGHLYETRSKMAENHKMLYGGLIKGYEGYHSYLYTLLLVGFAERSRERVRAGTGEKIQDDNVGFKASNIW